MPEATKQTTKQATKQATKQVANFVCLQCGKITYKDPCHICGFQNSNWKRMREVDEVISQLSKLLLSSYNNSEEIYDKTFLIFDSLYKQGLIDALRWALCIQDKFSKEG